MMKNTKHINRFIPFFIVVAMLLFQSCSMDSHTMLEDGESVILTDLSCDTNDCDGDGLNTSCDEDDSDAENINIKEGCDPDGDGFVDTSCSSVADLDGDGFVTEDERDINCDVCPGEYDPDQTDLDEDGIGDACNDFLNINESVSPPEDDGNGDGDSDEEETIADQISFTIDSHTTALNQEDDFEIAITINNESEYNNFIVETILLDDENSPFARYTTKMISSDHVIIERSYCYGLYRSCDYFDDQELTAPIGESTHSFTMSLPEDADIGFFDLAVRIYYVTDAGEEEYIEGVKSEDTVFIILAL